MQKKIKFLGNVLALASLGIGLVSCVSPESLDKEIRKDPIVRAITGLNKIPCSLQLLPSGVSFEENYYDAQNFQMACSLGHVALVTDRAPQFLSLKADKQKENRLRELQATDLSKSNLEGTLLQAFFNRARNAYITNEEGDILYTLVKDGKNEEKLEKIAHCSYMTGGLSGNTFIDYGFSFSRFSFVQENPKPARGYFLVVEKAGEERVEIEDHRIDKKIYFGDNLFMPQEEMGEDTESIDNLKLKILNKLKREGRIQK